MVEEMVDMENMVLAVVDWVESHSNWEETLVFVTADHETGYLTGPISKGPNDEKVMYPPIINNGAGNMPGLEFHSGGHTNSLVPLQAKGVGSDGFVQVADKTDSLHGPFMDNTDIAKILFNYLD